MFSASGLAALAFNGSSLIGSGPRRHRVLPGFSESDAQAKAVAAELHRLQESRSVPKAPSEEKRRDPLTDLFDRGVFDADLEQTVQHAAGSHEPLILVMVDVDRFKSVNDSYGHQKGDAVLRGVAAGLEAVARGKGSAYRYGGEELALILPNHTVEEGVAVAERLRRAIEAQPIGQIKVTISLGVACVPLHADNSAGLVGAADEAMYDAKSRGRNLVRVHGEPEPQSRDVPREVARRLPEPGHISDEERAEFRRKVARREGVFCPSDGAPFDIEDVTTIGSVGRDYLLICPHCGIYVDTRGADR
jgi:diguanylate cyclase (GGDEF)-like protein